jgi:predicted ribonuclease YlaK
MATAKYIPDSEDTILTLDGTETETLTGWLAQILDELEMSADQAEILSGIISAIDEAVG